MPYRIGIVDDNHRMMSQLKKELAHQDVEIVMTAINGDDHLRQLKNMAVNDHPQVVIMDVEMPIMGGVEAVEESCKLYDAVRYIMFTVSDDDDKLFNAIRAGASGYLLKDEPASRIFEAISEVVDKSGAPMSPSIARKTLKLLSRQPANIHPSSSYQTKLTPRETDILKAMVAGLGYKQIADTMSVSPNTVRNHIANIYDKLHITSKAEAVHLAVKNKWV